MTRKIALLTLFFTAFYSNMSESAEWIRPNLITDVGGNINSKLIFSLNPITYNMEWGIYSEMSQRNIGYFIMLRNWQNTAGQWKFLDGAYVQAFKTWGGNNDFSTAVNQLGKKTSIISSTFTSYTQYCVGFGYSSYTGQTSTDLDGRPKRVNGTDINFGDADMSCGTYVPNYIPCKIGSTSPLSLKFGNINLSEINAAKATAQMSLNCIYVEGVGTGSSSFMIKLKSGNSIQLNNGTEATIYIDGKKITSGYPDVLVVNNATQVRNYQISATLSGEPTKLGEFQGSGYLVMDFL